MFGFIADILTSVTSILLPVFFSYKALRTSDPAVLTPWLMYWTTLSLLLVVESQFNFILSWVPFYSWMRLGVHLYLVVPGEQQGSVFVYKRYIFPFLDEHERQIDRFISDSHAQLKAAGMDAVKRAIEYVRVQILGQPARPPTPPASRNVSYTNQLFERFAMPSARNLGGYADVAGAFASNFGSSAPAGSTAPAADIFGLLGKAFQSATGTSQQGSTHADPRIQARDLARSGTLIPPDLRGAERDDFVRAAKHRLQTYLMAMDAADELGPPVSAGLTSGHRSANKSYDALSRSRSESEFEDLGYDDREDESVTPAANMPDPEDYLRGAVGRETHGSHAGGEKGWSKWVWGDYGEKDSASAPSDGVRRRRD